MKVENIYNREVVDTTYFAGKATAPVPPISFSKSLLTLKPHEHYIPFLDGKIQQDPSLSSEASVSHGLS